MQADNTNKIIVEQSTVLSGIKNDSGKLRYDLIPPEMKLALAVPLTSGANNPEYGPRNWEKGLEFDRVYGAIERHMEAHRMGFLIDTKSGEPHLWHAFIELGFLVTFQCRSGEIDMSKYVDQLK